MLLEPAMPTPRSVTADVLSAARVILTGRTEVFVPSETVAV